MLRDEDPIKVLVVEDERFSLAYLTRFLRGKGFEVFAAENGVEAMTVMEKEEPHLVVTDWNMPLMNGRDLCKNIRDSETTGYTYIIVLTAITDKQQSIVAFDAGADDYMVKPFDQGEMLCRIRAAERILRLESQYKQNALAAYKVNAELAVNNGHLNQLTHELQRSQNEALRHEVTARLASLAKSAFLANMSHEIRTPLTAILGFAETLEELEICEMERLSAAEAIRRNGCQLLQILNDVLDLSRIEAGKTTITPSPCAPCRIIEEVAAVVGPQAAAKKLQFSIEYVGPIPTRIITDPLRFKQILINLTHNAIKFTERGSIRLIVGLEKGESTASLLRVDVIDSGIGIKPEQLALLGRPFELGDDSSTRRYFGSGLGLAISKQLAVLLGGELSAKSVPGQGSTFSVTVATGSLEGVEMEPDPKSVTRHDQPVGPGSGPPAVKGSRVLLAEDGLDNQRLIHHFLSRAGIQVTIVDDGAKAVEAVFAAEEENGLFDVVLMDMHMPVLDGYDATRQLRERGFARPILALTALAMPGDREKCLACGCNEYLTKPIDRQTLLSAILYHSSSPKSERPLEVAVACST